MKGSESQSLTSLLMGIHLIFFAGGLDRLMLLHVLLKYLCLLLISNSESTFSMQSISELELLELLTGSWPCMGVASRIPLTISPVN